MRSLASMLMLLFLLLCSLGFYVACSLGARTDALSAASFYIPDLPDLHQDPSHPLRMYGGHLSSDPNATNAPPLDVTPHLYFFMVKARQAADKERIIFWLNGGPGCSSFDGLMMEIGPWRTDGKGGLKTVVGGWEEYATVVFVDQPAGTGFLYSPRDIFDHELPEAAAHFIEFLRNFYKVFPEYQNVDAYLAGHGYAGQYIPHFADAVLDSNLKIPLQGAAIGNGWIDARRQYPAYLDYAVQHGVLEEGSAQWQDVKYMIDQCVENLQTITDREPVGTEDCDYAMSMVSGMLNHEVNGTWMCLNRYDIRLEDTMPYCGLNWPPHLDAMYTYLARRDVVRVLHADNVPDKWWVHCRSAVRSEFTTHSSNSSVSVLPRVLEKIPVLLFVGDQDMVSNYVGIENMIQAVHWNGETGLGSVQTQSWTVAGRPAGTWVTSRNLTYVKIFDASHMAGFEARNEIHDMMLRFMGVDFDAIADRSPRIPNAVGDDMQPTPGDWQYPLNFLQV